MHNAKDRLLYMRPYELAILISEFLEEWGQGNKFSGSDLWHIEDLAVQVESYLEALQKSLNSLDRMGKRYANNGNGQP